MGPQACGIETGSLTEGSNLYITPKDMLAGRQQKIHAERDRKLEDARKQRQIRRQQAA
jgi:hypothetical protein